jgi:hypothetical protein
MEPFHEHLNEQFCPAQPSIIVLQYQKYCNGEICEVWYIYKFGHVNTHDQLLATMF